jgi:heptosyltransferase II
MEMNPLKAKINRALVIHTAFPGDLVLATAFLRGLRRELPKAEIYLLTTPAGQELLTENAWDIKVISYEKRGRQKGLLSLLKMAETLRSAVRPDLTFNLHRSIRSALLARAAGAPVIGFKEAAGSFLFSRKAPRPKGWKESEKNLGLLRLWAGAKEFAIEPELQVSKKGRIEAQELLPDRKDFFVIAPGSVWATKRWPAERYGDLAARLQKRTGLLPVVVGGAQDKELIEKIIGPIPEESMLDLVGKTSLPGLVAVLARARFAITNDSAPLHIATAVGTPVLGIFGPTTEDLGFFPHAPLENAMVAERSGLTCRPCGAHGHRQCPLKHFRCMMDLSVDQVEEELKKLKWHP